MKPVEMFAHWRRARRGLFELLDAFSDEELSYRPFESSWPVGQIALHIADAEDGWINHVVLLQLPDWPQQYTLENYPTLAEVKAALTEVHARTEAFLDSLEESDLERVIDAPWGAKFPLGWVIWHVIEHEIHHRGELSLILGLLGREAPDV